MVGTAKEPQRDIGCANRTSITVKSKSWIDFYVIKLIRKIILAFFTDLLVLKKL